MSYKTNAKSLRLGISHSWSYKAHGPTSNFHIDHKIRSYLMNLIEYVIPQAPKKVNTKAKKERKYPVQPGLQGKTIVLRSSSEISVLCFYYLNYDGATPKQIIDFHKNISNMKHVINSETGYKVNLKMVNYFIFFWRYEAFLGINTPFGMQAKVNKCINNFGYLKIEREYYLSTRHNINAIKRYVSRFKKQRYFRRTFYPLVSAFIFFDFDSEIATKIIALELQMLRIEHKKFVHYIKRFFKVSFLVWNKKHTLIRGIQIKINGRMTDFRRQVRRTQTKIINIGVIKRSDSSNESGHSIAIAYNRYGAISVQTTYQLASIIAERWEDRAPFNPQLIFSTRSFIETCSNYWDFKKKKDTFSKVQSFNFSSKQKVINEAEIISKKYREFKKKTIVSKEIMFNQRKPVSLKLIFSDIPRKIMAPFRTWNEKNIFKKYIIKKN